MCISVDVHHVVHSLVMLGGGLLYILEGFEMGYPQSLSTAIYRYNFERGSF